MLKSIIAKNIYEEKYDKLKVDRSVKYQGGGFVVNQQLKIANNTKIQVWRWDSWDVIGLWAKVNNRVIVINSKQLQISE